jgi:hypothetical protein
MSLRAGALLAGAILTVGLTVYLLVAVRSGPLQPSTTVVPLPSAAVEREPAAVEHPRAPVAAKEPGNKGRGGASPAAADRWARPSIPRPNLPTLGGSSSPAIGQGDRAADELSAQMDEANRLYDSQDFDGALQLARTLLGKQPSNVRMLRVAVSAACLMGDAETAAGYLARLPAVDHAQMIGRCTKAGVTLPSSPSARPSGPMGASRPSGSPFGTSAPPHQAPAGSRSPSGSMTR